MNRHNARGEMYKWEGTYAFYESNSMMSDRKSQPEGERGSVWSLDSLTAARMGRGLRNWRYHRPEISPGVKVAPGRHLVIDAWHNHKGDSSLGCQMLGFMVPPVISPKNFAGSWADLELSYCEIMRLCAAAQNPSLKPSTKEDMVHGAESVLLPMTGTDYGHEIKEIPLSQNAAAMSRAVKSHAYMNLKFVDTLVQFSFGTDVIKAIKEAATAAGLQQIPDVQKVCLRGEQYEKVNELARELTTEAYEKLSQVQKKKVDAAMARQAGEWDKWRAKETERGRLLAAAEAGVESERRLVEESARAAAEQEKRDREKQANKNYQYALQKRAELEAEARKQERKIERLARRAGRLQQRKANPKGFVESDSSDESPEEEPKEAGMRVKAGGQFAKKRMMRTKHVSLLATVAEDAGFAAAGQAVAEQVTKEGALAHDYELFLQEQYAAASDSRGGASSSGGDGSGGYTASAAGPEPIASWIQSNASIVPGYDRA